MDIKDLFIRGAVTGKKAEFLVGRIELIKDIASRLNEDFISGIIYGTRGVGKTTIAWQVGSILENTNNRYSAEKTLNVVNSPGFFFIMHKCSQHVDTIGDLLIEILTAQEAEHSFRNVFREYIETDENISKVVQSIAGGFGRFFQAGKQLEIDFHDPVKDAKKMFSSEAKKVSIFNEVLSAIYKKIGDKRVLIVVDEFERPKDYREGKRLPKGEKKDIEGVGNYIKDNDWIQFLFVGISDNVEDLLKEHRSVARKMPGTIKQAPLMTDAEIKDIYHRAESVARGSLSIENSFLEQVIQYSSGLPWIAQHIGFEALREKQWPATLTHTDFGSALESTFEIFANESEINYLYDYLSEAKTSDLEILNAVWPHARGISEFNIRNSIPEKYIDHYDQARQRLIQNGILVQKKDLYLFSDPIVRVFSKKYIDDR